MHKFGLKLWSTNDNYVEEARQLYNQGLYNYIELYVIPDSYKNYINLWKNLNIPIILHAPHYRNGLNLSQREYLEQNIVLTMEVKQFADTLNAQTIIYHPGVAGDIKETIKQLCLINDKRIIIENKPYYTVLADGNICNGHSPEEIKDILDHTKIGFCLDIGHAFCSANAKNIDPIEYLKQFLALNPRLFHLTDNDYASAYDKHYHFGNGNYNIKEIFNLLPTDCSITIETVKDSKEHLGDFKADIMYLKDSLESSELG